MGLDLGHSRCKQPVAAQSIIKNAFGPSGIPDGLFLASKETSMIEITQVNASLDEAGDENACLIVGKRVAKCVLRCKDSEIKSIELHRKSIDARKKRDVHFILSFRVELTSPHLEREAIDSVAERDRSRVRAIEDYEPSFPSPPPTHLKNALSLSAPDAPAFSLRLRSPKQVLSPCSSSAATRHFAARGRSTSF